MRKKIILMRHGKPDFNFRRWIRAGDLKQVVDEYDFAQLVDVPSDTAIDKAQQCDIVVCSDLVRTSLSAQALGFENVFMETALFNEVLLAHPHQGRFRLPLYTWAVLLRIAWLFGYSRNTESFKDSKKRASEATTLLTQLTGDHNRILLVGHVIFNRLLTKELLNQGWQKKHPQSSKDASKSSYWRFVELER